VDSILAGLRQLGGSVATIVDEVPQWFLDGHRKPPTGRPPAAPPAVPWGPKIPTSERHINAERTYPHLLSFECSLLPQLGESAAERPLSPAPLCCSVHPL